MSTSYERPGKKVDPPSDFPSDFAQSRTLLELDRLFRCEICVEFYAAPLLLTPCSHTFCSKCIHFALANNKKACPKCFRECDESKLKLNIALAEVTAGWIASRDTLKDLQARANAPPTASTSKLDLSPSPPPISSRPTRSSTQRSKAPPTKKRNKADDDTSDIEIVEVAASTIKHTGKGKAKAVPDDDEDEVLIKCPLCSRDFPGSKVELHSSTCNGDPAEKRQVTKAWGALGLGNNATNTKSSNKDKLRSSGSGSTSKAPSVEPPGEKRLPSINLTGKKHKDLVTILETYKLSTQCPANVLQKSEQHLELLKRRIRQWVVLYNSNLDLGTDPRRKDKKQLKDELSQWETLQDGKKPLLDQEFSAKAYLREHREHFKELIEKARPSKIESATAKHTEELASPLPEAAASPSPHLDSTETPVIVSNNNDGCVVPSSPDVRKENLSTSSPSPPADLNIDITINEPSLKRSRSPSLSLTSPHLLAAPAPKVAKRKRESSPFDPEGPKPSQMPVEEEMGGFFFSGNGGGIGGGMSGVDEGLEEEEEDEEEDLEVNSLMRRAWGPGEGVRATGVLA